MLNKVLRAEHLNFSYGQNQVLRDVNIQISPGEFVALVGPNGSGKTTLLKILLGLIRPDSGRAEVFGKPAGTRGLAKFVGYVPQRPQLASDVFASVEEIVTTGRLCRGWLRRDKSQDREQVRHALQAVGLEDLAGRPIKELSGGEQQRAFIARALAGQPELLICDEPVAGVDAESQRLFRDSLVHHTTQHSGSVLLVSHELGAVGSDLDRVVVLKNTIRFDGTSQELIDSGVHLGIHAADLPLWLEALR